MGSSESICVPENDMNKNFEWPHPVLRRGGIFSFSMKKQIAPVVKKSNLSIWIRLHANGKCLDDNQILYTQQEESTSHWILKSSVEPRKKVVYYLTTPCDCEIGEYEATIMIGKKVLGKQKFLMLFNAWNPNDETYIPEGEDRIEYILNTETIVYRGYSFSIWGNDWSLNQFCKETIETLLYLLKKIDRSLRSCAYKIARELTALVNNLDDDGVLVGKWGIKFLGGKSPDYWSCSKEIFRKYIKTKRPVKYGQCFTFSALLCSLFRLAGIGCRIVTCYDCLYDSDDTLDMERYYDEECNLLRHLSNDDIWTFHCWNECYIKCPGVEKYNGWHAVDGTPQTRSKDGRYTCGPAPVAAIKAGDLTVGYDSRFIFSEVNGDVINKKWKNTKFETFDIEIARIGKCISTKAVGSTHRMDITHEYKYIDGSLLDIMARKNADGLFDQKHDIEIVNFRLFNNMDHILMGEDLDIRLDVLYVSSAKMEVVMKCFVTQHPNIRSEEISNKKILFQKNNSNTMWLKIASKDILEKVQSDLCNVLLEVFVVDGEKAYKRNFCIPIKTPSFDIILPKKVSTHKRCHICINLVNPFPTDLENVFVKLKVDFCENIPKKCINKITKGSPIREKFCILPNKKGFYEVKAIIYGNSIPTFKEVKYVNVF